MMLSGVCLWTWWSELKQLMHLFIRPPRTNIASHRIVSFHCSLAAADQSRDESTRGNRDSWTRLVDDEQHKRIMKTENKRGKHRKDFNLPGAHRKCIFKKIKSEISISSFDWKLMQENLNFVLKIPEKPFSDRSNCLIMASTILRQNSLGLGQILHAQK